MKLALTLLVLAAVATGCVIVPGHGQYRSAASASSGKKCPPGHAWSDGACHSTGKGHDK